MTTCRPEYRSEDPAHAPRGDRAPVAGVSWPVRALARAVRPLRRLHEDQHGTISIISIFAILILAMLMGMVMNVGRQADNKVKMQQAADAAANSAGIVLARGMNTLVFTNHLLCDVFALTAFMREARDRHSDPMVPDILAAWSKVGETFANSKFAKFALLGPAIKQKVPLEQQMVSSYSAWASATSEAVLPLLEQILSEELIPQYQRALVTATPQLAQLAANEVASRHGQDLNGSISADRGPMQAMIWNGLAAPIGGSTETNHRTLPVVDPELDNDPDLAQYQNTSRQQRQKLATTYLNQWNNETLTAFLMIGKMSQFASLWSGFTCGQLQQLLSDNQNKNLLFVIRQTGDSVAALSSAERNAFLESSYLFVAVCYWPKVTDYAPGLLQNPIDGDDVTYAQVMLFIPRNRLIRVWENVGGGSSAPTGIPIGGVPGQMVDLPPTAAPGAPTPPSGGGGGEAEWVVVREGRSTHWSLLNQSWRVQLVPATHPSLLAILRTTPTFDGTLQQAQAVKLPNLGNLTPQDLSVVSHH